MEAKQQTGTESGGRRGKLQRVLRIPAKLQPVNADGIVQSIPIGYSLQGIYISLEKERESEREHL